MSTLELTLQSEAVAPVDRPETFLDGLAAGWNAMIALASAALVGIGVLVPWLVLAKPGAELWTLMGLCLPVIPLGVWAGYRLHERLDQRQLYRLCYGLLFVAALKLLWDGLHGHGLV